MWSKFTALCVVAAVALTAGYAQAAPSKQALQAALEAIRLDFARDGVVGSPDEVAGRYQEACDLGYGPACNFRSWRERGDLPSLELAARAFADRCGRADPVACIVGGWAIESEPLPLGLSPSERAAAQDRNLGRAYPLYVQGCDAGFVGACHELARYSIARFMLGVGDTKVLEQRERGGRTVFDIAGCRKGYQPSCVELGKLLPQDPGKLETKGSAAFYFDQACESGYVEGCFQLASLLAASRSTEDTRARMNELCDRGHTASCTWVARSFDDTPEGRASALEAWQRACLLRDANGCRIAGQGVEERSVAQATAVHSMGCTLGDGTSCGRLGLLRVQQGQTALAVEPLDQGCAAGMAQACVTVGLMRLSGDQIDPAPERARRDLLRGCPEEGIRDPKACHALGRIHEDGLGVPRDRSIAARFYRHACAGDHVEACFRIGEAVRQLQRPSQSATLIEWSIDGYLRACRSGIDQACLPAAELLETGPPLVRDVARAREIYDEECRSKRHALACRRFANYLSERSGDPSDVTLARDIYEFGRELGDAESTRQLGRMYWYGRGGPRKRAKANRLFREACRAGNTAACGGVRHPDFGSL